MLNGYPSLHRKQAEFVDKRHVNGVASRWRGMVRCRRRSTSCRETKTPNDRPPLDSSLRSPSPAPPSRDRAVDEVSPEQRTMNLMLIDFWTQRRAMGLREGEGARLREGAEVGRSPALCCSVGARMKQ